MSIDEPKPAHSPLRRTRMILWMLVIAAVIVAAALFLQQSRTASDQQPAQATLGGPFTLIGGDGRPFAGTRLAGKPYAIFFGFTQCGDICPVTLGRLVKLRRETGSDNLFNIVFVTIDPENDGPHEVGKYAELFGSPIIGLTGSKAAIAQVKRQYGIYAEPNPQATGHGDMISHTSSVLLFDRNGRLAATISGSEADSSALQKLRALLA